MSELSAIVFPAYDFAGRFQPEKLIPVCSNKCLTFLFPHYEDLDDVQMRKATRNEFPEDAKCTQCDQPLEESC